jgi:hypothetical protein
LSLLGAGCAAPQNQQVRVFDLLKTPMVDRRPPQADIRVEEHTFGGRARTSLVVPPDSRVIWEIPIPRRAVLNAGVAMTGTPSMDAVTFRITVSDQRIAEPLAARRITAADSVKGWIHLSADLSRYAGWQWSLFYRPERHMWRIVLATVHDEGSPQKAFWALPGIDTDEASAKQFAARHGIMK